MFGFSLICSREGGSTAAVVTIDTVVDESRKMANSVTSSPARLCSRDGMLCYCGRLEYDFLTFVPCFLLFTFFPSLFIPACFSSRVPSSQQSSATLSKLVVRGLSCVVCTPPDVVCWVAFFCAFVPGTLSLDLPNSTYLNYFATLVFFLCLTALLSDHIICISRMNKERHWGYC